MWSAALGYPIPINRSYIENIFQKFCNNKNHFNFEDYKKQMELNPDMLAWFSKPEEAMNKRLHIKIDEHNISKEQLQLQMNNVKN